MGKTLLFIAMMIATVALVAVSKEPTIKRLDGSAIAASEVDATVTRSGVQPHRVFREALRVAFRQA
jgi:hypothetical protein